MSSKASKYAQSLAEYLQREGWASTITAGDRGAVLVGITAMGITVRIAADGTAGLWMKGAHIDHVASVASALQDWHGMRGEMLDGTPADDDFDAYDRQEW